MAASDDKKKKTKQKQRTVFIQVAADTLYQTRRNIFLEVSSYDKNTNCKPYPHFNNRK